MHTFDQLGENMHFPPFFHVTNDNTSNGYQASPSSDSQIVTGRSSLHIKRNFKSNAAFRTGAYSGGGAKGARAPPPLDFKGQPPPPSEARIPVKRTPSQSPPPLEYKNFLDQKRNKYIFLKEDYKPISIEPGWDSIFLK